MGELFDDERYNSSIIANSESRAPCTYLSYAITPTRKLLTPRCCSPPILRARESRRCSSIPRRLAPTKGAVRCARNCRGSWRWSSCSAATAPCCIPYTCSMTARFPSCPSTSDGWGFSPTPIPMAWCRWWPRPWPATCAPSAAAFSPSRWFAKASTIRTGRRTGPEKAPPGTGPT